MKIIPSRQTIIKYTPSTQTIIKNLPSNQAIIKIDESLNINNIKKHRRSIKNIKKVSKHKRSIKNKKNITIEIKNNNQENKFTPKILLISIIVLLILGLICILIILLLMKMRKPEKSDESIPIPDLEIPIRIDIITLKKIIKVTPEFPINISISELNYEEAQSILDSQIIVENHILLNETINYINNYLILCGSDIELASNNTIISYTLPNFLINPTKGALKIVKSDIEFYKKKYQKLSKRVNDFTKVVSESLKNLYSPLNDIKEELIKILDQYEETITNLSIPLILGKKGLNITINKRRLEVIDDIEEYKNETENLNGLYNELFKYINEEVKNIGDEINQIPKLVTDLQNKVEGSKEQYIKTLDDFNEPENYRQHHENLLKIKSSFLSIRNDVNEKKDEIEEKMNSYQNQYIRRKIDFEELEDECDTEIVNLNNSSIKIKKEIDIIRNENVRSPIFSPDLEVSIIIANYIIKSLDTTVKYVERGAMIKKEGMEEIISIINVIEKTSLDLLFLMDITGSMTPYLDQSKQNIINIMNKIILECPGIDINLGFIGYRDVYEINNKQYVDIDFTLNHANLQNSIQNVIATGGKGDGPEDVAWALERALDKNWKNNARFAILVADYPCHGAKYHSINTDEYPNGVPGRKEISQLVRELAENNISLFCMRITQYTDIMFEEFKKIYNNFNNCEFRVVPLNSERSLSNIVVDSAADVYVNQRNIET